MDITSRVYPWRGQGQCAGPRAFPPAIVESLVINRLRVSCWIKGFPQTSDDGTNQKRLISRRRPEFPTVTPNPRTMLMALLVDLDPDRVKEFGASA